MGFELNRIMKQYGVSTPGMASYTGTPVPTAPTAPTGSRPADDIGDADLTDRQQVYDQQLTNYNNYIADPHIYKMSMGYMGTNQKPFTAPTRPLGDRPGSTGSAASAQAAYDKQLADFNAYTADPNALNEQMRKYNIDKEAYDKYKTTYQSRLQNTPMYAQGQFQAAPQQVATTVADLYKMYLGRDPEAGIVGTAAASTRPNFMNEAQAELLYRNLGNQNLMNATGSYYGNQLKNPIYGAYYNGSVNKNSTGNAAADALLTTEQLNTDYFTNQLEDHQGVRRAHGGSVHDLTAKYADGGPVSQYKTSADLYRDVLGREPESQEVQNNWNAIFGDSIDADEVSQFKKAAAPELIARTPANISGLYQEVLGRAPDLGGAAYWAQRFGSEVDPEEAALFTQAAQPEIAARAPAPEPVVPTYTGIFGNRSSVNSNPSGYSIFNRYGIQPTATNTGGQGGGGSTTKDKLEKAAINAALSYAIGPTYDYANAANSLLKGDVGSAAGSLVSGLTGGASNAIKSIAKKFRFEDGGSVHSVAAKYAHGGPVKTHYQTAGAVRYKHDYMSPEEEEDTNRRFRTSLAVVSPTNEIPDRAQFESMPPVALESVPEPRATLTTIAKNASVPAPVAVVPAPAPVAVVPAPVAVAPKAAVPFGNDNLAGIQALLAAYGPKDSAYAADLKTARATAKADSDEFARMLTSTMSSPEDAQNSKAEIYFRLAAAFGAPTKTGQFSENLGMVGKELGEYAKGKRATAREKQLLGLEVQKLKMASSKEDLNTLRGLSAEEMKDKRAIATELIKNYIESGKPQSAAGKQALDEGLVPGTPAYQARVAEIGNANVEAKMAQINSALSGVSTAAANLAVTQSKLELDRQKFDQQKAQQAKLSPGEVKLKVDAEDTLAQTEQAMTNLKKAYSLNPNTFDGSLLDVAQRKLYESSGSKDPKVVATRELENLLKKASLSQLKATFPGAISNDERAALDAVQGLDAKSKDERAVIMKNAFTALKSVSERHRRRLNEINQGVYRDTAPIEEGDK